MAADQWLAATGTSSDRGSNTTQIAPGTEHLLPSSAVFVGGEAMTTKLEVVVDLAMGGQETLCVAR